MKVTIALCLLCLAALTMARPGDDQYTDKYDNVDVEEILANDQLLQRYMDCVMGRGKCTADGKELKDHMQDALETDCSKCTEEQKKKGKHVIKHLINKKPAYWKELTDKYDPQNKYSTKYEKELSELKE